MDEFFQPVPPEARDIDRVIYRGAVAAVGTFQCRPSHPLFRDSGPIRNHCIVFPRTAVAICHRNGTPFQADMTVATVYTPNQEYQRQVIDGRGDRCDYFVPADGLLGEMEALFSRTVIRTSPQIYARQRTVVRMLQSPTRPEPLALDQAVIEVLADVADLPGAERGHAVQHDQSPSRHGELVRHAQHLLAVNLGGQIDLPGLAARVGCSVFHLCRVFRTATGRSIHEYRTELRLRASLDLLEAGLDIIGIALELGFSSHSHFSDAFRRRFGATPRAWRRAIS